MRLLPLLTTKELQDVIENEYEKLLPCLSLGQRELRFCQNTQNAADGEYVYANELGYHYVLCERGNEERHKISDDVIDIMFWALNPIIIKASFDYAAKNRNDAADPRRSAYEKQLEYWGLLDENLRKRGEIEISAAIKANPLKPL